jgi:hypothetical protein
MKNVFSTEAWEQATGISQDIDARSGLTKKTKEHVETIVKQAKETGFSIGGRSAANWHEFEVEISEEEMMLRALAKSTGVAIIDAEMIYKEFKEFDTDNSGTMDASEFRNMMIKMHGGMEPTPTQLRNALAQIDEDRSGDIDFPEFFVWYAMNYLTGMY